MSNPIVPLKQWLGGLKITNWLGENHFQTKKRNYIFHEWSLRRLKNWKSRTKQRERKTERQRETERQIETERQTERDRERQRKRQRETEREVSFKVSS